MGRKATEIRKGMVLQIDNALWAVTDYDHHTPGNLRAIIRIKIKNLSSGASKEFRAGSGDVFEVAYLEKKKCQFLYKDQTTGDFIFMDEKDYEQYALSPDLVGDAMRFVVEQQVVDMTFHEEKAISVELPSSVVLTITEADPAAKGNTVTNVFKRAVLETGFEIKVPAHINSGERVKVSTETGEFLGRSND